MPNDTETLCDVLLGLFPSMSDEQVRAIVRDQRQCTPAEFRTAAEKCYRASPNGFLRPLDLSNAILAERRQRPATARERPRIDVLRGWLGLDEQTPPVEIILRNARALWMRARARYGTAEQAAASVYRSSIRNETEWAVMDFCITGAPPKTSIDRDRAAMLAELVFLDSEALFDEAMADLRDGPRRIGDAA